MRDRRNTSLSISSTASANSCSSASSKDGLYEKTSDESPPLSPSLPSPVTKCRKNQPQNRSLLALKAVATLCGLALIYHYILCRPISGFWRAPLQQQISNDDNLSLVGNDPLPDFPTPLIVADRHGQSRWTVSIPPQHSFPLNAGQYCEICSQIESMGNAVADQRSPRGKTRRRKAGYYSKDPGFLDVGDAQEMGALSKSDKSSISTVGQQKVGTAADRDVCKKSMTFSMATDDAGFGRTLLLLWLSYGLAKKEGRAFFIDDTRWAYGNYTSYFKPPPSQNCFAPPASQVVPCPHTARHILVSAATVPWTFGPFFEAEFQRPRRRGVAQQRDIFDMMRHGFEDLFRLNDEDMQYAADRSAELKHEAGSTGGAVIGMHMRRGDLHPFEYQFSNDYLPMDRYANAARKLLHSHVKHHHMNAASPSASSRDNDLDDFCAVLETIRSPIVLASDDPKIYESQELSLAVAPFTISPAQHRIQLATKAALDKISPAEPIREPGSAYVKHVDENSGWEGGFYSALFFSLGTSKHSPGSGTPEKLKTLPCTKNSTERESESTVSEQTFRIRELIGRAYILDLAVLGKSDGVVCAVSSSACRILAVMMGWDAMKDGQWKNVDDGRAWSWNGHS